MGRAKRGWYSQFRGTNHLISRITSGDFLLQREEKESFKIIEMMIKKKNRSQISLKRAMIMRMILENIPESVSISMI